MGLAMGSDSQLLLGSSSPISFGRRRHQYEVATIVRGSARGGGLGNDQS